MQLVFLFFIASPMHMQINKTRSYYQTRTLIISFPFNGSDEIWAMRLLRIPTFFMVSSLVSGSITRPPINTISYSMLDCAITTLQKQIVTVSKA